MILMINQFNYLIGLSLTYFCTLLAKMNNTLRMKSTKPYQLFLRMKILVG